MLFTIEQLELIKKLQHTGMSSDQLLKAFGELEVPEQLQNNNTIAAALYSPLLVQHLTTPKSETPVKLTVQTVPTPVKSEPQSSNCSSPFEHPICSNAPRPIRSQRTPMKEITTLDDPNELEEFMKQGEEACILDMKTFITQYSLRQTTVAMMTGVSQPYISKLLNGNHRELSLRCRKNIYCWYLNCRRHPNKLAAFLADPTTRLETNGDGELIPQRRERYVFRPILIRMLESFFTQTPFPDLPRRVEIANACNHVLKMDKKGVGLMPKEVVSPQVVSNWFANKRKELRRRSAEASAASTSSASSSASSTANHDSVSVSSMSPRDEETSSRNTTPETAISPSPAVSTFEVSRPSAIISATSSTTSPISIPATIIPSVSPSALELFAMAQQLGVQLPVPFPTLPTHFFPFQMAPFYGNPASILKSE
ncbi:Homeobox-containing protein 1 [Caenorhabditis elegans]|uniref:Homeobox-containing protein 1 n=1 Tax=Caenorhabditis elegans TaxID=6239 RepID=HMBX1_CAEEL|nr:Homeobox-containing protein 1 [Caenorhabditis elegans]Q9TYT0.1 RecName: Full=Homeobox-containing protein 1 [Caenorhabditis elegans]CCD68059.1 Homeobox-containing protein 1 [Caenorhabditis elegans]|eukprot:NP_490803.1 HMBOX (mammalian HoMeoBOX gene) homolog [Caenorhabditis elegans]